MPRCRTTDAEPKGNGREHTTEASDGRERTSRSREGSGAAGSTCKARAGSGCILRAVADTRVLLLGNASSDAVARVLSQHDRFLTRVEEADEAIRVAAEHQIIVIDAVPPPRSVASVCRDIRAQPGLADQPILAISPTDGVEDRIRLLEAGADDVMARPVDERELDARIEALDLRFRRSKDLRPAAFVSSTRREGRRLVVVFSPKGGVGTTTVAVNLALAIAAKEPDQVALVDLAPVIGSVGSHLNVHPRMNVADLGRDMLAIGDREAMKTYLEQSNHVQVLTGSTGPAVASRVGADNVGPILETVLLTVPTVVVDAGSHLDPRALAIMELADNLLVVVAPELPALQAVHAMLEYLHETSSNAPEATIVLNEVFGHQMLTPSDIEGALGKHIAVRIPHDAFLFQRAVNEGSPVVRIAGSSPPAQRFSELASLVMGEDAPTGAPERRNRRLSSLFGRS
jgi:pilus assembly protein CpaE